MSKLFVSSNYAFIENSIKVWESLTQYNIISKSITFGDNIIVATIQYAPKTNSSR